jgi:OmpA-OmpF porin, OOP family
MVKAREEIPMNRLAAFLMMAPLVIATPAAFADSSPSADQIIKSLKPTGNLAAGGTRGIRLAAPSGETPVTPSAVVPAATGQAHMAAAKPARAPAPAAEASNPSVNLTVNFKTGSAELTPEAMATLDQLGSALSSNDLANYRFRIEGHTDTVGSKEYNKELSERRAQAVVHYITSKYGVLPNRLEPIGMGSEGLLVPTPDQTPEPRNRRVQVVNLGA